MSVIVLFAVLRYWIRINTCLFVMAHWPCNSLWGGSVINLGTKKHKDKFFDGIDNLDYLGCFAMTELHHGNPLFCSSH